MASRTTREPDGSGDGAALQLLRLLANSGTVAEITELDAPETERDLALRIREDFDRRRRREAELSALVETARDLASLSDPKGVLDAIVRRARALLATDLAYLTLFDPEHGDTYMRATDGSISAEFQSVRLSLGDGLGGLAAKTRKAYWTADYFADHRFQHTGVIDHAVADEGIVAICGTPLIAVDDFVGVLFAANRSPRPFTHDEVALLSSLATLAAVSLVQVRALAETEQALAALSEAHETVRRHTAGVERAAAAHDRFADLVLGGGGADDITKALVDLLGGWAVVLDDAGVRRSEAGYGPDGAADPTDRDPLADAPPAVAAIGSGRLTRHGDRYAVGIAAGHEALGLLVLGGLELSADDADLRTVERAAMVTALVMLFERQTADAQQQMRTDLVADLVAGRGDRAELTTAARAYGLDPARPFCLLALVGEDAAARRALALSAHAAVGSRGIVGEHDGVVVALVAETDAGALASSVSARIGRVGSHHGRRGRAVGRRGRRAGGVHRGGPDGPRHGRARPRRNRRGGCGPGFRGPRRGLGARRGRLRAPAPRTPAGVRRRARHRSRGDRRGLLRRGWQPPAHRDHAARARQHRRAAAGPRRGPARCHVAAAGPGPRATARAAAAPPHAALTPASASSSRRSIASTTAVVPFEAKTAV